MYSLITQGGRDNPFTVKLLAEHAVSIPRLVSINSPVLRGLLQHENIVPNTNLSLVITAVLVWTFAQPKRPSDDTTIGVQEDGRGTTHIHLVRDTVSSTTYVSPQEGHG